MSQKKIEENDLEKEKWNKLEHIKCTICKEEFYFIKKEFEEKISEDEFADEPFTELPIFKNSECCPFCKASKKRLLHILSEEEIKKKKEDEKEKLEKRLKEIAEEEAKLEKIYYSEMKEMCKEITSDTMDALKDLEHSLRKKEITIDRFEDLFFSTAFEIMQRDVKIYNKRNKEVSLDLSNSFVASFREAILDFNLAVRTSLKDIERRLEEKNNQIAKNKEYGVSEVVLERLENAQEDLKHKTKEEFKQDISNARKYGKNSLDDDFRAAIAREVKIK